MRWLRFSGLKNVVSVVRTWCLEVRKALTVSMRESLFCFDAPENGDGLRVSSGGLQERPRSQNSVNHAYTTDYYDPTGRITGAAPNEPKRRVAWTRP